MAHRVSLVARADLDEMWQYVSQESGDPRIADRLIDAITERFYLLSDWPLIGRTRNDLRVGLRSYPSGDYLIFYRIQDDDDVIIQRVLHGRRNLPALFG